MPLARAYNSERTDNNVADVDRSSYNDRVTQNLRVAYLVLARDIPKQANSLRLAKTSPWVDKLA